MEPNGQIARRLEETASLLETQGANPYRVAAYRRAAAAVRNLAEPISSLFNREGMEGLRRIPGIGERLAVAIRQMILTGRLPMLEHLRGETDPVILLQSVPGIGPVQAERLHHGLGIDTLEDLEAAAHDGRLRNLAGFGAKRTAGIIDSLATRLGRVRRSEAPAASSDAPIEELLDIDREYREAARAGTTPKIAPRRFNPSGDAWLPILHTERGGRHYTALFSNTARAHALRKTGDWVVIYHDGPGGRQNTVITSPQGPLRGLRIVPGREAECQEYYARMRTALPRASPGDPLPRRQA
jgi:DNA polymerase (family 10)